MLWKIEKKRYFSLHEKCIILCLNTLGSIILFYGISGFFRNNTAYKLISLLSVYYALKHNSCVTIYWLPVIVFCYDFYFYYNLLSILFPLFYNFLHSLLWNLHAIMVLVCVRVCVCCMLRRKVIKLLVYEFL